VDEYSYARDHNAGPGAWCVIGPDGFKMVAPQLDKSVAFIIGKLLSRDYAAAKGMLDDLARNRQAGSGVGSGASG
jgi:hypothetical protein